MANEDVNPKIIIKRLDVVILKYKYKLLHTLFIRIDIERTKVDTLNLTHGGYYDRNKTELQT